MLAFAVYQNGVPLEKWPEAVASRAYCAYLADAAGRPQERAFDFDYGRLAAYCAAGAQRRLFLRYPVRGFGDPVLRTRLLRSGPALRNLAVELALGRIELLETMLAGARPAGAEPSGRRPPGHRRGAGAGAGGERAGRRGAARRGRRAGGRLAGAERSGRRGAGAGGGPPAVGGAGGGGRLAGMPARLRGVHVPGR